METGLSKITVGVKPLIEKLKENKSQHVELYEEACKAFKKNSVKYIERKIKEFENSDGTEGLRFNLAAPTSYESEYTEIIGMLEFSLATAGEYAFAAARATNNGQPMIELTREEFRNYVQDDWGWKQQWSMSVSGYVNNTQF